MANYKNGINYCYLDETNVNNIISELETPSFGYDKKLIIVKNAGLLKKIPKTKKKAQSNISNKLAEYVKENIELINESIVLVIIEGEIEKGELLEVLKNNNIVICEFQRLKLNEIAARLQNVCKLYDVEVEEKTLLHLVEVSGTSMQNLMNEIRKLIEYVGKSGKITIEDINKLAIPEIDNIIFNLTDSLGMKDVSKAIQTLRDLIYLKESLQSIMINLYRHFKKIYYSKLAEKQGLNIAEILELRPNQMFLITKYKKQAEYFTEQELENILNRISELDEKSKTGNIDLELGLETLLCSI